ncbi:HD domain-containing protein [Halorarius halobius]|uniref:HD domain-containing protein n=1 Tax=Halorarius halobius TaxID=2962671 RepID=UPI0020CDFD1E|nr:HD domain-containing protein [Halorarius halobius]
MPDVLAAFPELADVDDPDLREGVRDCWATACEETETDDLTVVPWFPPAQRKHGIEGETLVAHVRDVVAGARALADALDASRGTTVDRDLMLASALVHDVSKLYEFDGHEETAVGDLLGHPYYGVYCVAAAGLPVECAHVVLAHTSRTTVEPAFLEAELVRRADEAAAAAVRTSELDDLRDA